MLTKFKGLALLKDLGCVSRVSHLVAKILTSPQPLQGYGASSTSKGESGYAAMAGSIAVAIMN